MAWTSGPDLARAHKLYSLTEFQQSLEVLQAVPNKDAAVFELMGRNYYGLGDFKKATEVLEKAAALEPESSDIYLWLGRAYGRRAETSSMLTAPGFATKARQFFERAAQLNPNNLDAQSDLFEYYLEAPGFLGGGFDKASATAAKSRDSMPPRDIGRKPSWPKSARNSPTPKRICGGPLRLPPSRSDD